MPSILSKLPKAHSNGLTPRSCKKKDASFDVISDYYTGVRGKLERSEEKSELRLRVGSNRICNINCIQDSANELLCKQCVLDYRAKDEECMDKDLERCGNEMSSPEGQLFMKEFLKKYKTKRRRNSVRRTAVF